MSHFVIFSEFYMYQMLHRPIFICMICCMGENDFILPTFIRHLAPHFVFYNMFCEIFLHL